MFGWFCGRPFMLTDYNRVSSEDSGSCVQVNASRPLLHLRKVKVPSHLQWEAIFIPPHEGSPNDLPFGEALMTESPLSSLYWYHGTRLRRPLIRLVALFCTSKLVFQLLFFPSHFHPDESVCVITILMRPIKVIMMSVIGKGTREGSVLN